MDSQKKNLLVFGYGLALILGFISFKLFKHYGLGSVHGVLLIVILFLIFVTKFRHDILLFIYNPWMKAAHFIGNIVTGLILGVLFYGVFGVVGIVLRLIKKDLLDRRIDVKAKSYWLKRQRVEFNKEHYLRQF